MVSVGQKKISDKHKSRAKKIVTVPMKIGEFFARFSRQFHVRESKPKTDFVKRMRELDARIKPTLIWDSKEKGTYKRQPNG